MQSFGNPGYLLENAGMIPDNFRKKAIKGTRTGKMSVKVIAGVIVAVAVIEFHERRQPPGK